MKTLLFALIIFILLALPVMAQDPTAEPTLQPTAEPTIDVTAEPEPVVPPPFPTEIPEVLPETAAKGLDLLALAVGALAGLIGKYLTNAIKDAPFLSDGDKSKISGPAAALLAGVVSILMGYLLSMGGVAANFLDSSGVWQVLVTAWPWAVKWYHDSSKPVVITPPADFPVHTA